MNKIETLDQLADLITGAHVAKKYSEKDGYKVFEVDGQTYKLNMFDSRSYVYNIVTNTQCTEFDGEDIEYSLWIDDNYHITTNAPVETVETTMAVPEGYDINDPYHIYDWESPACDEFMEMIDDLLNEYFIYLIDKVEEN